MTRKTLSLSLAALGLLGAGCSSMWQTGTNGPAFMHGGYRLGGAAAASYQDEEFNGVDTNTLGLAADLGRFYGEHLELGLRLGYQATEVGTAETDQTDAAIFGRWYTATRSASRPFVELGGGLASVDDGTTSLDGEFFFFALGLLQFLNDHVAGEIVGRQSVGSFDGGVESDALELGIGLSIFW